MSKTKIHQHVKYSELSTEWYDFFTDQAIYPEIYFPADQLDSMKKEDLLNLEKELHQKNLGLSIHAPYADLSPGASDIKIREVTQYRLSQTLDLAEVLRPTVIDCHPHYDRHRFGGKIDPWVENCAILLDPLAKRAEKMKVILALENTFEDEPTPIDKLIEKVGSPSLRACFDNGHFHLFHKVSLKKWWEILGEKTVLLHLHDNHGERDEHLPPGEGNYPFPAYFNLLKDFKQERTCTLECRSLADARKGIKTLRKFLTG